MPYPFKHQVKQYSNARDFIMADVYTLIPRVSDVITTLTCDWTAWDNDVNRVKRGDKPLYPEGANRAALRGTIGHYEIEEFICDEMQIDIDPLSLSTTQQKLYTKIVKSGEKYDFEDEIARSVENFVKWWDAYAPTPIYPEKEIIHISYNADGTVDPTKSLKGTIDFVGMLDIDKMSRNALIETKQNGLEITHDKSTCLIDWKTGATEQKSHAIQLVAYNWLLKNSGLLEKSRAAGEIDTPIYQMSEHGFDVDYAMCVKFGTKGHYLNTLYDVESETDFFRAWDRFNDPTPTTYSTKQRTGNKMKSMCMMCEHRNLNCPFFEFSVGDANTYDLNQ